MPERLPAADNLYVHFPFCRNKCSYCALYSRAGSTQSERAAYVSSLVDAIGAGRHFKTAYFGGGTPMLCDLTPLLGLISADEFTVELHPLDAEEDALKRLRDGGVNRISMGIQSLNDEVLADMGRGYTFDFAARAFELAKATFDNAGIDLIVGYPGESFEKMPTVRDFGLTHCSVYSLQNERGLKDVPDDDTTLDRLARVSDFLSELGLVRYEISNYALPGCECRHNLAVWNGEDYIGLGDGACGRIGLMRTRNFGGRHPECESVTGERDEIERTIFSLRTRKGIDASGHPEWLPALDRFAAEGILCKTPPARYRLTRRGTETCDTVLSELV